MTIRSSLLLVLFLFVSATAPVCIVDQAARESRAGITRHPAAAGTEKMLCEALNAVRFIENRGQYPPRVMFASQLANGTVFFCRDDIVFALSGHSPAERSVSHFCEVGDAGFTRKTRQRPRIPPPGGASFSIRYTGAGRDAAPVGVNRRVEQTNFFLGNDSAAWRRGIATFDTLAYRDLYPGVDLVFFGSEGRLKYEFRARDPDAYRAIEIEYWNVDSLSLCEDGALHVSVGEMKFIEQAPIAYQIVLGRQVECPAAFRKASECRIGFNAKPRFGDAQLVIDPVYSTLFGGGSVEGGTGIVRLSDDVYCIGGVTDSRDFPVTPGAMRSVYQNTEGFLIAIDIVKGEILYSTFIGGSDDDVVQRIMLDAAGRIVIAGVTRSPDFPVTQNAYQRNYRGDQDCFVAVLDSGGSPLIYSTFIGGAGFEDLFNMTLDRHGNAYITGLTDSRDYPVTSRAYQRTYGGGEDDIFLSKFDLRAYRLEFSTFIGGYDYDEGYTVITDSSSNVYVGGLTNSSNFPVTKDAFQPGPNAGDQGVVAVLDSTGARLLYGTYIGGSGNDLVEDLGLDSNGRIVIFDRTTSYDLRTTSGVFQRTRRVENPNILDLDFSILKLDSSRRRAVWWTYLSGSRAEYTSRMIISGDRVFVFGESKSDDYPIRGAVQDSMAGGRDIVISVLDEQAQKLLFSTYYGGSDQEAIINALLSPPFLLITGFTYSKDYSVVGKTIKDSLEGIDDAYLTVFDLRDILVGTDHPPAATSGTLALAQSYPNPFSSSGATIEFHGVAGLPVELVVSDSEGRVVARRRWERLPGGSASYHLPGASLQHGVYFCTVRSGREAVTKKLVKCE
jgi:hypothetical protein